MLVPMREEERHQLVRDLRHGKDETQFLAANRKIHKASTRDDLPWLMSLLHDPAFTVREAAAWPISELAGVSALPELLRAYQRGLDDGHDNDGLSTAQIELVESDMAAARRALNDLAESGDPAMRDNAKWLIEFCREP
jgi:HEAT repeat protein